MNRCFRPRSRRSVDCAQCFFPDGGRIGRTKKGATFFLPGHRTSSFRITRIARRTAPETSTRSTGVGQVSGEIAFGLSTDSGRIGRVGERNNNKNGLRTSFENQRCRRTEGKLCRVHHTRSSYRKTVARNLFRSTTAAPNSFVSMRRPLTDIA